MSKKSHHFLTLWPWPLTYDLEKLIRSGHYHYQCAYQIWEQSIPWFLSYRVNTIAGGGRLRRKTITSPDPSDTGDIIKYPRGQWVNDEKVMWLLMQITVFSTKSSCSEFSPPCQAVRWVSWRASCWLASHQWWAPPPQSPWYTSWWRAPACRGHTSWSNPPLAQRSPYSSYPAAGDLLVWLALRPHQGSAWLWQRGCLHGHNLIARHRVCDWGTYHVAGRPWQRRCWAASCQAVWEGCSGGGTQLGWSPEHYAVPTLSCRWGKHTMPGPGHRREIVVIKWILIHHISIA